MYFDLPTGIPERIRPKLKLAAFAGGHGITLLILAGHANSFNGLYTFLDAYVGNPLYKGFSAGERIWTEHHEVELRGDWSVCVRQLGEHEL
jgi:hypothetical protein